MDTQSLAVVILRTAGVVLVARGFTIAAVLGGVAAASAGADDTYHWPLLLRLINTGWPAAAGLALVLFARPMAVRLSPRRDPVGLDVSTGGLQAVAVLVVGAFVLVGALVTLLATGVSYRYPAGLRPPFFELWPALGEYGAGVLFGGLLVLAGAFVLRREAPVADAEMREDEPPRQVAPADAGPLVALLLRVAGVLCLVVAGGQLLLNVVIPRLAPATAGSGTRMTAAEMVAIGTGRVLLLGAVGLFLLIAARRIVRYVLPADADLSAVELHTVALTVAGVLMVVGALIELVSVQLAFSQVGSEMPGEFFRFAAPTLSYAIVQLVAGAAVALWSPGLSRLVDRLGVWRQISSGSEATDG